MPPGGHWGERFPLFRREIVGLVLGVSVGGKLAAQHKDLAVIEQARRRAAGCQHRRRRAPGIGGRIVDVVLTCLVDRRS